MSGIELIRNIHNVISVWDNHFLIIYVFLFVVDTLLLIIARKYRPSIKYFRVHEKYGLMKISLLKILFIGVDMYIVSSQPSTGAFTAGIQLWYATFIFLAFRDLMKKNQEDKKQSSTIGAKQKGSG
jgi:Kef-type K+ transport system membrane component KefB